MSQDAAKLISCLVRILFIVGSLVFALLFVAGQNPVGIVKKISITIYIALYILAVIDYFCLMPIYEPSVRRLILLELGKKDGPVLISELWLSIVTEVKSVSLDDVAEEVEYLYNNGSITINNYQVARKK